LFGQIKYSAFAGSAVGNVTAAFTPSSQLTVAVPVKEPLAFWPNTSNRTLVTPVLSFPTAARRLPVSAITASGAPVRVHSANTGAPAGGFTPNAGGTNGSTPLGSAGSGLGRVVEFADGVSIVLGIVD
jgi:hypothetical protein